MCLNNVRHILKLGQYLAELGNVLDLHGQAKLCQAAIHVDLCVDDVNIFNVQ